MAPQNALRTINLYRSFSQVSTEEDVEPGFQIGMKGEESFFQDMGLQNGDIIRSVNSMKMRTQRRAEYLMREFYKGNMSAVVMDVERNGEVQQHIYLVR
jgi:type II secretory pathway component PulC